MQHEEEVDHKSGGLPPQYEDMDFGESRTTKTAAWWKPRYWRKRTWAIVAGVFIVIIAVVVAVAVALSGLTNYPDYKAVSYALRDTYEGENFFDQFNYFTGWDPTKGFVHYVPRPQAQQLNLTYASTNTAIVRVDTSVGPGSRPDASTGRFSVRLESKKTYGGGLFVFDVKHTPHACGTWPALWLTDPSHWPDHGEIDIMESINNGAGGNQMSLHTADGCSMAVTRKMKGHALHNDCNQASNGNAGCGVTGGRNSFGPALNAAGGSVMAVEWREAGIRVWQFGRGDVPSDVVAKRPNPAGWGTATADFPNTRCGIGSMFRNNSIVIDIDLCGDMVYGTWDRSSCPSTCTDLVSNQPALFKTAYWEFGSFQVYQPASPS
ncbi:glycoside hydrolase family 16 [Ophiocordyceps camponoti-floridani]|uniref:Glycoside hydrolase family 16 n=1 Tax=Ophiocordyceps camponoti-floridani TaxID=2030778 RepID=A0A8H4VC76_9HYPO|nr:glycoside hydrolase family 16 [Ophiocordyceps camponoti-floridani]